MPILDLGKGRKIFYTVQGKGTPLVFLHGAHGTHNLWKRQLQVFAPQYKVVSLDMRGHGSSFKPRSGYRLEDMVEDVMALVDHLRIKSAVFIGSSMGGVVAQMIGIKYPSRVKALVLVGTLAKAVWMGDAEGAAKGAKSEGYERGVRVWFTPQSNLKDVEIALREASRVTPFFSSGVILENPGWDIRDQLWQIKAPTLIVVGKEDLETTPVKESRIIHRLISNSKMHIVPKVGHLVMLEAPDAFNKLLADFLNENVPS